MSVPDRARWTSGEIWTTFATDIAESGAHGSRIDLGRIEALLSAMTLEEKLGQLTMVAGPQAVTGPADLDDVATRVRSGKAGSVLNVWGPETRNLQRIAVEETRLGLPLLLALDVIHGHRTIFPVSLGETCAMDPSLWERTARAAAEEASEDGIALTFAPMLDVARDPRWGRIVESPGEDPFVAAAMAGAKVRGFQGPDLAAADSVAATAKHLCGYGAVAAGREYASIDISDRTLQEVYLPPFAAAVEARVAAVMPAFVDLAGVPMTAHVALLRGWLRDRLGFDGVVVSDYNAVAELIVRGVAGDLAEAAALALNAGVDIDMAGGVYLSGAPAALERGLLREAVIDESVRRVLLLKARLGLFEAPFRRGGEPAAARAAKARERRRLAREAAAKSIVLLVNRNGTLPLSPHLKSLALIGPFATARADMLGSWALAGDAGSPTTVLEGLRSALPGCAVSACPGVDIDTDDDRGIADAVVLAQASEAVILCLGESAAMSGESASRARLDLPGRQQALADAVLDAGRPTIVLIFSGRPLALSTLFDRADAALAVWFPGDAAGTAIADVLTGAVNPSGRLPFSWPRTLGQVPIVFSERRTGRPGDQGVPYTSRYLDVPNAPAFPFGHGLSYCAFSLDGLEAAPATIGEGDAVDVSVVVSNGGPAAGIATLFLFIRDPVASVGRPALELKGFLQAALAAGESRRVSWRLTSDAFRFPGRDLAPVLEAGAIELHVGESADPTRLLSTVIDIRP